MQRSQTPHITWTSLYLLVIDGTASLHKFPIGSDTSHSLSLTPLPYFSTKDTQLSPGFWRLAMTGVKYQLVWYVHLDSITHIYIYICNVHYVVIYIYILCNCINIYRLINTLQHTCIYIYTYPTNSGNHTVDFSKTTSDSNFKHPRPTGWPLQACGDHGVQPAPLNSVGFCSQP